MSELTLARLRHLLVYNPETGVFRWNYVTDVYRNQGCVAGGMTSKGYTRIKVDGVEYRAGRLAWFYTHGHWPKGEIDHIDRNQCDDRIANLRDVTSKQNNANRVITKPMGPKPKQVV